MRGQIIVDFIVEHRINGSMVWKSAMLLVHHGNYISMDRFAMMVKELVLLLFLRMVLF